MKIIIYKTSLHLPFSLSLSLTALIEVKARSIKNCVSAVILERETKRGRNKVKGERERGACGHSRKGH